VKIAGLVGIFQLNSNFPGFFWKIPRRNVSMDSGRKNSELAKKKSLATVDFIKKVAITAAFALCNSDPALLPAAICLDAALLTFQKQTKTNKQK